MALLEKLLLAFQTGVHEHTGEMRIGDNLLDDGVAPERIARGQTKARRVMVDVVALVDEVALLLVKKRFAVGDEVLQVARLRHVDARIVNLVQDAVRRREPHAARGMIGGADAFLGAVRPGGRHAGPAEAAAALKQVLQGNFLATGALAGRRTNACRRRRAQLSKILGFTSAASSAHKPGE